MPENFFYKIPEFYEFCPKKIPEFYIIIARKIFFFPICRGTFPPPPVCYAYATGNHDIEVIEERLPAARFHYIHCLQLD